MTNSSRSPRLRFLWALVALGQLTIAVGGPLVDAAFERDADRVAHIESESGEHCGVHHDHLFCQICRAGVLGREAAPIRVPHCVVRTEQATAIAATGPLPSSAALYAPLGSRAPPLA